MAKALVGHRAAYDQRLVLETIELRRRVRDLEGLVAQLQRDNDALRGDGRPGEAAAAPAPTIAG
jgi:hypothetical protein